MKRFGLLFCAIAALALLSAATARAANDPKLLWRTIETEHFRVNFYSGEERVARHVAALAESIHARLAPVVGWEPSEKTEIALTDQTDGANGSATALPFNAVRLFVTAPDDLSPLGDVDDWYLELVTHEYTHILHTDHIGGIPALVNRVLGKTIAPNQMSPRWVLEGLAVFEESSKTSGGRLRSSQWNMFIRADVLENNLAPLDVFSNTARRWPQGNLWYLYGSFFLRWVAETYGEDAIRKMIDYYGSQIVPYALNRAIRRATGRTFEELYEGWVDSMRRDFGAQAAAIRARGVREGRRITTTGQVTQHARWIPKSAWPGKAGDVLYYLDDAHTTAGFYRLPIRRDARGDVAAVDEAHRELLIRGGDSASFLPDGAVVFNSGEFHNNLFLFSDLFSLKSGETSPTGLDGKRVRLTDGFRALDPDVSPDGRRVVFTSNHRGTTYLQIADLTAAADGITNLRTLVRSDEWEQRYTPRWSPDGRFVAFSTWTRGGYRDVKLVEVETGAVTDVTHDRAVDGGPSFSPDGAWLFFHSDRTGVMNVYAWEMKPADPAKRRLKQVTNVINGAYQPAVSPDNKTLLYLGYTHAGFDLFAMHLDEREWLDALPYEDTRPEPPPIPPPSALPAREYNPWKTLQPRKYSVQITPGNFGQAFILSTAGEDIAGHHAFAATMTVEAEHPEVQADLQYTYGRLPFDAGGHLYRFIAPRTDYSLGQTYKPRWVEEVLGADVSLAYSMPRAFETQSFSLAYSFARTGGELPAPIDRIDPYETPHVPTRGVVGSLHLAWSYSNAERFLWSVGPEKGFSVGAEVDVSDPALASEFSGYAGSVSFSTYFRMPWAEHHSLALHASGGSGGGNLGTHGLFYIGGFLDENIIDTVRNSLIQGGVQLRGYPVLAEIGHSFGIFNAEYRFPIVNVDRGLSTLPVFLNRVTGAAFVDYGSAFDDASQAHFKTGVGGELWFDMTLGYVVSYTFRLGYAKGLASTGIDKLYFVAAVPF